MKLYYAETLNPRKVCALARFLEAPLDYVRVDLAAGEQHRPWFLALNPNAKVPVLERDDGRTIWESDAILCHLALEAGSPLWPTDARQVEVLRWLHWSAEHFTRQAGQLYFQYLIRPRFGLGEPDAAASADALKQLRRHARILEAHLAGREWLLDDQLTIADFTLAAALPYAAEARIPLEEFDEIRRWHGQLDALPAWREPFPAVPAAA